MPSVMTRDAKRDAVGRIVPPLGVRRPRLGMVDVETTASGMAILARPIVVSENGDPVGDVLGVFEVGVSQRRTAALPVRVSRTNQVQILRRTASRDLCAPADRSLVFGGKAAPGQRGGDVRSLALRDDPPGSGWLAHPRRADFRADTLPLGRVVSKVAPGGSAGVRTEPEATGLVGGSALFTNTSRHKTEFTTWN